MRLCLLLLVACGGEKTSDETGLPPDGDADSDADADADSDADTDTTPTTTSTTTSTTLGTVAIYAGTLDVAVEEIGFVVNEGQCRAAMTLTIDPAANPVTTGSAQCTIQQGPLTGQSVDLAFEAPAPVGSQLQGTVTVRYPAVPNPVQDSWRATIAGDGTVSGQTDGSWQNGSAGFTWDATFDLAP